MISLLGGVRSERVLLPDVGHNRDAVLCACSDG